MTIFANGSHQIATGQVAVAVTGTAVALGTDWLKKGVVLCANSGNASPLVIGPSTVTNTADGTGAGFVLQPGQVMNWTPWGNDGFKLGDIYVNGTAGDWLCFMGN